MSKIFLFVLAVISCIPAVEAAGQTQNKPPVYLSNPLSFPIQLSGSFGDLRANHFHTGYDFRTNSSEGHPLYAVSGGYVSRITVGPYGYGLAVYVAHPADSLVTVYGHLQQFTYRILRIVRQKQYENENFSVDISLDPKTLPVKQGDIIGYSGNSGSSGGPHLHLDIRDMRNNDAIDPSAFYKSRLKDTRKPLVRGLMIYPIEGKGAVNGSAHKQKIPFALDKHDNPVVNADINAWGEVGLSVRAVDRMDGTNFSYGIRDILQTVDGVETFRLHLDRIPANDARYINSCTDYEEWSASRAFYVKTFADPGYNSPIVASRRSGKIVIDEERLYNVVIALTDAFGNSVKIPIRIQGKKQAVAPPDSVGATLLRWYESNIFEADGIRLTIPLNCLYNSVYMRYSATKTDNYYSPVHVLHPSPVPLHRPAELSIKVNSTLVMAANSGQFGLVRIAGTPARNVWTGGKYKDGRIEVEIRELGTYAVARDAQPPNIVPLNPAQWEIKKKIAFRITDNLSGIASYRGEIDGRYALFEYDAKNALLSYAFDDERLHSGLHRLRLAVDDSCGNKTVYECTFRR